MKKMLIIAAALALLPMQNLRADLWARSLLPDATALEERGRGDSDDPYHRSGSHSGETQTDVVDVLIAFDLSAQNWLAAHGGGTAEAFATRCIDKANFCLTQSAISEFRFRLAGTVTVAVDVSSMSFSTLLSGQLVNTYGKVVATGELKKITDAREATGADIVTVLLDAGATGEVGMGYMCTYIDPTDVPYFGDWAYNVCSIPAVDEGYTMVHEIAHNMGCGHPDESMVDTSKIYPGPQSRDYSAGTYFWVDGVGYNTIMGYNFGGIGPSGEFDYDGLFTSLPMFSSPLLEHEGVPLGDANHDNRRVLLENYQYVAQYRVSKETTGLRPATNGEGEATSQTPTPTITTLTPVNWYRSKADAIAAANAAGKRILLVGGRDTCGNTQAAKNSIEHDLAVNAAVTAGYVCWYDICDDPDSVFWQYCETHGSVGLPLICVINPASPDVSVKQTTGYRTAEQIAEFLKDVADVTTPEPPPAEEIAVAKPSYVSEFTYDGTVKQSLLSVAEGVEVSGDWYAVRAGEYTYTLELPEGPYKWADGTKGPLTITWKIKEPPTAPAPVVPEHPTIGEINPDAEGYVAPCMDNGDDAEASSFKGDLSYAGWVRGNDNSLLGSLTIKAAKAGGDANSKLTITYTPCGQQKQTYKTQAQVGGNPEVVVPGLGGSIRLCGDTLKGVGLNVQAGADYSSSKDASAKAIYSSKLSAKVGTWTFAINTAGGYAAFSLTIDKKGKGKLKGTLPDGTKVSISSQGAMGDNGFAIPFLYAKSGSFGFVFWAKDDGTAELSDVTNIQTYSGNLRVNSWTEPSRLGGMAGGNHTFVCGELMQDFSASGSKWYVPRTDSKLKLTFTQKTGLVKGSFVSGGVKYTVNGVVVDSEFYGSASARGYSSLEAWAD